MIGSEASLLDKTEVAPDQQSGDTLPSLLLSSSHLHRPRPTSPSLLPKRTNLFLVVFDCIIESLKVSVQLVKFHRNNCFFKSLDSLILLLQQRIAGII